MSRDHVAGGPTMTDVGVVSTTAKTISGSPYVAGATTAYFGLTLNELGVAVGIVATVITLGVNWWYKHQHLKLARREARRREQANED